MRGNFKNHAPVSSSKANSSGSSKSQLFDQLLLLLTLAQVSKLLGVGVKTAKSLLTNHNIAPIYLGRGRGKGLRWQRTAVIEFVDILHTEAQANKNQRRAKISPYSVRGKSAADLFAEFQRSHALEAEVCNGN